MPPQRRHLAQRLQAFDPRRLGKTERLSEAGPGEARVTTPGCCLPLGQNRLDAAATLGVGHRLPRGLAEQFGQWRVRPEGDEAIEERLPLRLKRGVEESRLAGRWWGRSSGRYLHLELATEQPVGGRHSRHAGQVGGMVEAAAQE